jgi:CRP-like cAMP-binding protein
VTPASHGHRFYGNPRLRYDRRMATVTLRTTADRIAGVNRMIRALGRDPSEWELSDLSRLATLRAYAENATDRAVVALRDQGVTDREIGEALGVSRQAVSKRWPGGGRYVGAAGRYRTGTQASDDDA